MLSRFRYLAVAAAALSPIFVEATVLFQDSFSTLPTQRNRYGSERGDFVYHSSYALEGSITNALNAPNVGVNAFDLGTQPWAAQQLKVMAHEVNTNMNTDNVVQVAAYFDRTQIAIGESITFDVDVHAFSKSAASSTVGINNAIRFGLVNMQTLPSGERWNRAPVPVDATVGYEGSGSSTFQGTGFMSNVQTGLSNGETMTRINSYNRKELELQRLATNTGGWTAEDATRVSNSISQNIFANSTGEGVKVHLNQSIKRVSENTFSITSSMSNDVWGTVFSDWTYEALAGQGDAWATFDTLFFTVNSGLYGFERTLWDNFSVAVVPEVSKALFCFMGLGWVFLRRRRAMN